MTARARALAGGPAGLALVGLALLLHVSVGAQPIPPGVVWAALTAPDPSVFDHLVVRELRLPRALFAAAVGAALAVAGALLQAVTRNPLAEPAVLGLSAGASVAVVLGAGALGVAGPAAVPLLAALGALGGGALAWAIARAAPGRATPLTLILAGVAVTAVFGAVEDVAILLDEQAFRAFRVWLTGTLAGRDAATAAWALPWLAGGLAAALLLARPLAALAMGDEAAAGLGADPGRLRALAFAAAVALTAAAVAIAGPMGFVGLVGPHAARLLVGADPARVVPASAVLGAAYVLLADTAARTALAPVEVSTGLVTALLGAPVFLALVATRP